MPSFQPQQVLRRQLVIYPIASLIAVVGVWGYWAFAAYTGNGQGSAQFPTNVRLICAIIATILIPIGLWFSLAKTRALVSRGRMTQARLVKFGSAASKGMQMATFEYVVDGRKLTVTQSVSTRVLEQYSLNMKAPVIYDAAQPSRAQVFPDHNGEVAVQEPTVVENLSGELTKWLFAGLLIAQMVVGFVLLRLIDDQYDATVFGPMGLGVVALTLFEMQMFDMWRGRVTTAYKARARFGNRVAIVLGLASLVWTPLAMRSVSATEARDRERQEQNDKDRAIGETQSIQAEKTMEDLHRIMAQRDGSATTAP